MAFTPNLGPNTRIAYLLFGLFCVGLGWYSLEAQRFLSPLGAWTAIVAGAVVALEGAAGF